MAFIWSDQPNAGGTYPNFDLPLSHQRKEEDPLLSGSSYFCNSYYKRRAYLQSDPLSLSEELLLGRPKLSSELDPIMDFSGGHESL